MDFDKGYEKVTVELRYIEIVTLAGNLTLALKHPDNNGPSSQIAYELIGRFLKILEDSGMYNKDEMKQIWQDTSEQLIEGGYIQAPATFFIYDPY